jgi:CelD/BcsL family acetyltransferase involved in cellulose biosynthesis
MGVDHLLGTVEATARPAPSSTVIHHVHHGDAALRVLGPALDALHEATGSPVTARRPWVETWLEAHSGWSPLAVTVTRGDALTAAALLVRQRRAAYDDVRAAGFGASDEVRLPASDVAAAHRLAVGMAQALADLGRPWRLSLRDVPQRDPVVGCLEHELSHVVVVPGDVSPRLTLGEAREVRSYVSRNHHQQTRRLQNRISRDGHSLQVQHLRDPAGVDAVLPEVVRVCQERDHELRRFSNLDRDPGRAFFIETVRRHAARGEVELTTLRLDEQLAAYVLCFRDGTAWRMWNCRFAPDWGRYGPGRLSHDASLQAALDTGCTLYDWMRGDEAYKDALSDHVHQVADLHAASHLALWSGLESARRARVGLRDLKNRYPAASRTWEQLRPWTEAVSRSLGEQQS